MILRLVGAMLSVIALAIFPAALPQAVAATAKPLEVGINVWVGWMPWWIVEQKGLLKKHGANVRLKFFGVQSESMAALASNHLDACALATNDVISVNRAKAHSSIVLLNDESSGADMLIARGLKSGSELKGRKIAVEMGGVSHFFLSKLLEKSGLSERDVTLTNMTAADAGAAFIARGVDVAVTWEPYASQAIKAGGTALLTSKDTPNLIVDVLAVRNPVLKTRREDLVRLVAAWFDALDYVRTNPEDAFRIMAKASDVSVEELRGMWSGVKMYSREDNLAAFGTGDGPYYATVDGMSAFMVRQKLLSRPVSAKSMLDSSLLR